MAIHRKHHQYSDETPDPHTPLVDFLWAHVGWVILENSQNREASFYERYARDILKDPYYLSMERRAKWIWMYFGHAAVYFLAGLTVGWLYTGQWLDGVQFGASLLVWGVILRTVTVWHVTWSVNSLAHIWGYQNYQTGDQSRNKLARRRSGGGRRLAQQSSRRPASGQPRPQVVGMGCDLLGHSRLGLRWAGLECRARTRVNAPPAAAGLPRILT